MHDAAWQECEASRQEKTEGIELNHGGAMGCSVMLAGQTNTAP